MPSPHTPAQLLRRAQRLASEAVGATALYAHLRAQGSDDAPAARAFVARLDREAADAQAAWQRALACDAQRTNLSTLSRAA